MAKVDPLRGDLILGAKLCKVKPGDPHSGGSKTEVVKTEGKGFTSLPLLLIRVMILRRFLTPP